MRLKRWFTGGIGVVALVAVILGISGTASPVEINPSAITATATPATINVVALSSALISAIPLATAVPPTAVPSTQTLYANSFTHTVGEGETLYRISVIYGVSVDALIAANGLIDPNAIYAGQIVVIPVSESASLPAVESSVFPDLGIMTPIPVGVSELQGIPLDTLIVMPPEVVNKVKAIYALGQALGRNPRAFSKLGDSTIESPHFLTRFDQPGQYNLGSYAYLQAVIDYFRGSFSWEGYAIRRGLHSWSVNDAMWSDKSICGSGETILACEIRLHNPSFIFIRLGSNDAGVPEMFDQNMRQIVEFCINSGVVPMIGTKADRHEGSNRNNDIMRQIAADYRVPLWDFDLASATIPGRGIDMDGTHLTTFFAHDWRSSVAFQRGHGVHSLLALMTLQRVLQAALG